MRSFLMTYEKRYAQTMWQFFDHDVCVKSKVMSTKSTLDEFLKVICCYCPLLPITLFVLVIFFILVLFFSMIQMQVHIPVINFMVI